MSNSICRCLAGAALLCVAALPAAAHVTFETGEVVAGATIKAVLRIPHGCAGEATKAVHVEIPEGFYNVKPMPKAGWVLEERTGAYAKPFESHGETVTQGVLELTWSGGDLPDAYYDEFVFRGSVGSDLAPGSVLYFPTTQDCETSKAAWTEAASEDDTQWPAPALTVTAAGADEHEHHAKEAAEIHVGALTLSGGFSRATRPGAPVAGGFLTITNTGQVDDRLIGASSDVAGVVQIHEMATADGVMKMRELPDGLPIPAGQTVTLKPGGYHVMFMDLKQPLVEGQSVSVTLTFERAGTVTLPLAVLAPDAKGAGAGAHSH